jgi:hypothetical protein
MARAARKKAPAAKQLQMEVDAIVAAPVGARETRAPQPVPPASVEPTLRSTIVERLDMIERPPFGGWLTRQPTGNSDAMDMLIKGAKGDPSFPKAGDPDAVRKHLGERGADPDVFEAIDDAELSWLAY